MSEDASARKAAEADGLEGFVGRKAAYWPEETEESAEGRELHLEGVRIAASYFRYRGAEILSQGDGGTDAPDICCSLDGETVLADMVSVAHVEEEVAIPELSVTSDDFWRCRRKALLWLSEHRVSAVRYDLMALGIFAPRHARIRHLAGVYFWSDEPDQLAFYADAGDER